MRLQLRAKLLDAFTRTSGITGRSIIGMRFEVTGQPECEKLYLWAATDHNYGREVLERSVRAFGIDVPTHIEDDDLVDLLNTSDTDEVMLTVNVAESRLSVVDVRIAP